LRDISRLISERRQLNVLICDERGEISEGKIGNSCDVMKYSDKATAFEAGIRAMRPDVIITDELSSRDCDALRKAIYAGVKVIASAHFSEFTFINSSFLDLFDRYVFLKDNVGNITNIYNRDGRSVIS
jgi:stage III sporulation protein SpoIIIAA